jgi:hypothetical protein
MYNRSSSTTLDEVSKISRVCNTVQIKLAVMTIKIKVHHNEHVAGSKAPNSANQ